MDNRPSDAVEDEHITPYHTLIIGAGPAGLTAARALLENGVQEVCVLEKDAHYVGGISRTVNVNGYLVDIGGHRFFSKSERITKLWHEVMGADMLRRPRKSRIYFRKQFFSYPLKPVETFFRLGPIESFRCVASYLLAQWFPTKDPKSFEAWVSNHFGKRLYSLFFKTYTEKVWGMSGSEISADWAAQRIKGLSLSKAICEALGLKPKEGVIKTLIHHFYYPRKGPGMLWEKMAQQVQKQGVTLHMGTGVTTLSYDDQKELWTITAEDTAGKTHIFQARHLISSMPLKHLVLALQNRAGEAALEAANSLSYRDFLIVLLMAEETHCFDDNWLYIHDPSVKVGRIQNFKSWSPEMVPDETKAGYGLEYFCFEGDGLWQMDDGSLVELAREEFEQLGLVPQDKILGGAVIRQKKAYPVYDHDYQTHIDTIRHFLEQHCPNLQAIGRNGMHRYNNQDHAMMTGILAAENITKGTAAYNLWQVNQDAEYHEEGEGGDSRSVPRAV